MRFAIFVLFISSALFAQNAGAALPPILFTKQRNGTDNIYLRTAVGTMRQLTGHARKDSSPVLSPDGRFLLFASERVGWWKIWLMDIASENFRQLTDDNRAEYAPCWSPDGDSVVFVSTRDGNPELYVMNWQGQGLNNITRNSGNDNMPHWAVDNRIYYSSEIDGVFRIVRIDPDGTNREILGRADFSQLMPQVSPGGQTILYYSDINGNVDIYSMDIGGTDIRRLTEDPLIDMRGRWSPDGRWIVFERGDRRRNHHIFVMDESGARVRRITETDYNYAPAFATYSHFLASPE